MVPALTGPYDPGQPPAVDGRLAAGWGSSSISGPGWSPCFPGLTVAALPMAVTTSASHMACSACRTTRPSVARTPAQDRPRKPAADASTAMNRSVPAGAYVSAAQLAIPAAALAD